VEIVPQTDKIILSVPIIVAKKIKGIHYLSIIDLRSAYLKMTLNAADTWATTFH
jgi:hypothetical protein